MSANPVEAPIGGCGCGPKKQTAPHTCPYKEDIHDDSESLCTCCKDCKHECAMDI